MIREDKPCHGDMFHTLQQWESLTNVLPRGQVRIPLIVTDDSGIVTGRSGDRDRRYETVRHSAL
ncbi:hypothetical protein AAKU64_004542 [Undibacterium sp. GrIS 1.8]